MQKEKSFFIAISFVLSLVLLIIFLAAYSFIKHQQNLTARHHLLCEVLRPGMSKDQVLSILKQAGEFTAVGTESPGPVFELYITFTDPRGKDLYGFFNLAFSDDKYAAAYVRNFDSSDGICEFYSPIGLVTETPRPWWNP